jgi:hypothetical protein
LECELRSNRAFRVRNKIVGIIVLLIGGLLAAFLPEYIRAKRLENELRQARQEIPLADLRDLAALTYVQASQKNYGLAADTSARFFNRLREVANQAPEANDKKSLEDLLIFRDKITAELAKGDPGALSDLQQLFLKTRQATAKASPR